MTTSTASGARTPAIAYDSGGVLWLAYLPYDGGSNRVVVDKTCDDGATWSGPVVANASALLPELVITNDPAPMLLTHSASAIQFAPRALATA